MAGLLHIPATSQWRVAEINITHPAGNSPVAAWVNGLWALDFRPYKTMDGICPGWALPHIPTGYMAAGIIDSLQNAQAIAARIDALGDWNFTDLDGARKFGAGMVQLRDTMPDVMLFQYPMFGPGFYYDRGIADA